ncbi:hypothetical protein BHE90_001103 [Fusarium euwallaceae]|uniref:Zn(2)-C6 fungal-type domain-containing protein n=3 Tax=Fusarium solani species complex TaxID=232080 RepID=A0A3M2RQW0_9HYPO|nr:hypothetical protein CDV36_012721 [Fusarium kuroshium]RSL46922.1 hypothetical protein CEP51_015855 [Fusarium floridanum]RTE84242.1 hypothetical protein BHE90_001103 [Fusarium euwallaceae]
MDHLTALRSIGANSPASQRPPLSTAQKLRAPRRSHRKTRAGCQTCKRRKVKCDEQRPSCANCIKRGHECEFLTEPRLNSNLPPAGPLSLNMLDLRLMHNFTNSTYTTFSRHQSIRSFWKGPLVAMALQCDYLMRALLATSALHMAHNRPDEKEFYVSTALTYHRAASREAVVLLADIKKESAEELFMFSILTIVIALSSHRESAQGNPFFADTNFPEWPFLIQGTKSLLDLPDINLREGRLSPLLTVRVQSHKYRTFKASSDDVSSSMTKALDDLEDLIGLNTNDGDTMKIYTKSIAYLRDMSKMLDTAEVEISEVFGWICVMADDFLPLLRESKQEAVAIFSYFCVFLKRLEMYWWMGNWGEQLLRKTESVLDNEHRLWIAWPMEELGMHR